MKKILFFSSLFFLLLGLFFIFSPKPDANALSCSKTTTTYVDKIYYSTANYCDGISACRSAAAKGMAAGCTCSAGGGLGNCNDYTQVYQCGVYCTDCPVKSTQTWSCPTTQCNSSSGCTYFYGGVSCPTTVGSCTYGSSQANSATCGSSCSGGGSNPTPTSAPAPPPGAFNQVSAAPVCHVTASAITFKWNASSGATSYHIHYRYPYSPPGPTAYNDLNVGNVTSVTIPAGNSGGYSYDARVWWYVTAYNSGGSKDSSDPNGVAGVTTLNCTPINLPKGWLDSATCSTFTGWACDADNYSQAINVHFYDGPGFVTMIGAVTANKTANAGVGAACGGNTAHGFSFTTPANLKNNATHQIYAYGINIGSGQNTPLLGNPKPITCAPPVNGACAATHYNCSAGNLGSTAAYSGQWQWWCNGSNGGTNILCNEMKCNTGSINCGACSVTCGSGTRTCTHNTYSGGGYCSPTTYSQSCVPVCPLGGQSCVSNACVCNAPPSPTSLAPSGTIAAGTRNITWKAVSGVTTYALRVDDGTANGWNGLCSGAQNPGDVCNNNVTGTSYSFNFIAGHQYHIWVHAIAACGVYSNAGESWANVYTNVVGQVYIDYNGNGAKDAPADRGYVGVKVTLSNGQNATTDLNGNYAITNVTPALSNVLPGTYTASIAVPNGYILKYPSPYPPTVYAHSPSITQNFGIQPPPPVCNPNSLTVTPSTVYAGGSGSILKVKLCVPGGGAPGNVIYTWPPVSPGSVVNVNSNTTTYTPPAAGSTYTKTVVSPSVQICNPGALNVASACTNLGTSITVMPVYTVSGNVFVDANKNQLKDVGEPNYSPITITSTGGSVTYPSTGFKINNLPAGPYTVSYISLPTGSDYQMTFPKNGPPPFFTVNVGAGCSVGISNSASCDANGNITNLNFGITNSIPWIQSGGGGDIGAGGGINAGSGGTTGGGGTGGTGTTGGFNDIIPNASTVNSSSGCGQPYASITGNNSLTTPGLIFTGNGSAYFGQGSASFNKWLVGGTNYPESFGPINQGGLVKTSYAYLQSIAKQAGITPVDLSSDASFCSFGGLTNCKLSPTLPHGIYVANSDLTLTGNGTPASYTFPSNQGYIILVHGNLTIQTQLRVLPGSTALFSASGNITVNKSVGEQNYKSTASDIEGVFSADQNFVINGQNNCTIGPDLKLNVAGSIITNAALNGGTFINQRDLCQNNLYCPVFTVQSRPDFILNAPNFIKKTNYVWQEVAP